MSQHGEGAMQSAGYGREAIAAAKATSGVAAVMIEECLLRGKVAHEA